MTTADINAAFTAAEDRFHGSAEPYIPEMPVPTPGPDPAEYAWRSLQPIDTRFAYDVQRKAGSSHGEAVAAVTGAAPEKPTHTFTRGHGLLHPESITYGYPDNTFGPEIVWRAYFDGRVEYLGLVKGSVRHGVPAQSASDAAAVAALIFGVPFDVEMGGYE